jgi:hypothetical protein
MHTPKRTLDDKVNAALFQAERKAWKALAGYKFWMFGYHAAQWVLLNQTLGRPFNNPWRDLVETAKAKVQFFKGLGA